MIKITVPATTANMGAGFDSIGMALNLYNELIICDSDSELEIEVIKQQSIAIPTTKENYIYQTMLQFYREIGKQLPNLKLIQSDDIPLTRGLGSSAACIVAGLIAANKLSNAKLSIDELVDMACKIERHPDNVTPAFFGGIVVGALENDRLNYVKVDVPDELCFAAMIPHFPLATEYAREILPKIVTREEAIYNISRASLFIASIVSKKFDNLNMATHDALHQPYRKALISNMDNIFEKSLECSANAVFLSGAGPTLIAIVKTEKRSEFQENMNEYLKTLQDQWSLHMLEADNIGARVTEI